MSLSRCRRHINYLSSLCLITVFFGMATLALAQDYRGKVQGTVTDEAGGAIPGANVVLHNDNTGVDVTRQTNGEGHYIFDFVDPGTYTVIVEQTGFKKSEQKNVTIQQQSNITADIKMAIGGVDEVVTVESPPVQVEFNNSSSALTIEQKVIEELPIRGRNPYNVATLDPTVSPGTGATSNENRPYHHAYANDLDAGGGTRSANDVLLDGVPLTTSFKTSYTPAMDAVQEVTFQKNAVDSEYGYSAGGIIVLNMKSGTNEWHGSAFVHGRDPRFNAVSDPTPLRVAGADETRFRGTKLRIYGGSLGGPIIKNKLFTFTSYEKWTDVSPVFLRLTVPTALERGGNFSQSVRTNGAVRNIFDPFTSTGASGVRTQFAGNVIPTSRFDPVAVRFLAQIPLPTLPGSDNNLEVTKTNNTTYWNFSERIDWTISENWKAFVRYGHFKANLLEENPTEFAFIPVNGSNRYGLSIAADTVYTLSPKWVLNLRGNFHQITDEYAAEPALLGEAGLAALWGSNTWYTSLFSGPNIYYPALDVPSNANRLGRPGREFWQHPQGFGGSFRLNTYVGNHSLKFGGELRIDKGKGARFEPLNFFFRQNLTANQASSPNLVTSGNEWASFLLGGLEPNGTGNTNNNFARLVPVQEVVSTGYSAYFMDDWKFNQRLTLNLGLRWEYEPGPVDAQNRLSQRLDLSSPIPEFQTAPPAIPATVTNLLATRGITQSFTGAWVFTDENNRHVWQKDKLNLLPRIGMAYRLNDISVIRFGYARYMEPSSKIRDPLGDFVDQYTGYSTTTFVLPLVNGVPQQTLADPFPASRNPVQLPTGKSLGRYTNLGNPVTLDEYHQKPQINDRFTLSYQRQIWGRIVLDLDYFFNRGSRLPVSVDLNMVDPEFSYTIPRSILNQNVTNPFFNILTPQKFPGTLRNQATISIANLLRPYPQYGAITQTNTAARSERLHSLTISAQRPFSKGLSFLIAYAYNRERTTEFFDEFATYNRQFEWRDTDSPRHRITNVVSWDIPIGRGRWLLTDAPRAVDMILGGWQFTTSTRYYSGRLLQFNQNLIVTGSPRISGSTKGTTGRWFDTSVFQALPTTTDPNAPPNLVRRTNPWTFPGLFGPSIWQTDMTMSKTFSLTERFKLTARIEAYNAFNHLNWDNPGVNFNAPATFGKVTTKVVAYNGREMQFGLRLTF